MPLKLPSQKQVVRWALVLFLIALGGLLFLGGLEGQTRSSYGERVIFRLLGPLAKKSFLLGNTFQKFLNFYSSLVEARKENEHLKEEVIRLKGELAQAREHELEYERLLKLFHIAQETPFSSVPARIVGKPLASCQGLVIIDKGKNKNVLPGMPVIYFTPERKYGALVGQVVSSTAHFAKVLLLTDPSFAVDVLVQRSRQRGIVKGRGDKNCSLELCYVPAEADVRERDWLVTSGMDGLYPKGILVGEIEKIIPGRESGLFKIIKVRPAVNLYKLEQVLVILKRGLEE